MIYKANKLNEIIKPIKKDMIIFEKEFKRSISSEIDTIDIYYAGFFTVKISIQINGENIHQDRLNFFDKLALKS